MGSIIMIKKCKTHCTEHDMSYFQHMRFAWGIASRMFFASILGFIHGLIPCVFKINMSNTIKVLYEKVKER